MGNHPPMILPEEEQNPQVNISSITDSEFQQPFKKRGSRKKETISTDSSNYGKVPSQNIMELEEGEVDYHKHIFELCLGSFWKQYLKK